MAVNHIYYDKSAEYGRMLKDGLSGLENGQDKLNDVLAAMEQMKVIGGNAGDATTYTTIATRFGFADGAAAKAAYDEISSLMFKLNTNASVSDVAAALAQAFAKFR